MNIIGDGRKDILLNKLEDFKARALDAAEKCALQSHKNEFARSFIYMCTILAGISAEQVRKLDKNDLIELDNLISRKVQIRARLFQLFMLLSGPIAWLIYLSYFFDDERPSVSGRYIYHKNRLKKVFGIDYFPVNEIKNKYYGIDYYGTDY